VEATHERLREIARKHSLGPDAACIVEAATGKERRIPSIRLSDGDLVQLGYGSLQRRIWGTRTDRTGAIAEDITWRRELTFRLLQSCGLPVGDPDRTEAGQDANPHRLLVVGGQLVAAARLNTAVASDILNDVHPETAASACLAARILGLDIAGVDIRVKDITHRLSEQGGAITAVHADPGLQPHLHPDSGKPSLVGRAIVDSLFPAENSGRIPVIGITGSHGTAEISHLVTEFLRLSGKSAGLACADGLFLGRRRIDTGDCANWWSGTRVLMDSSVDAAVLENGADVILNQGLSYDRCQVGVVSRIEPEGHFGRNHVQTPEQVFQVFRTQVDVVLPTGVAVLNAADPMVAEMAPLCDGEVIFFSGDSALEALSEHRSRGGRAVFVRENNLILASADEETQIVPVSGIPFLNGDSSGTRLENVLAAVATAWALEIAHHIIRTGLGTFSLDPTESNPLEALSQSNFH
jgi:cyanophycin synthetase